MSDSEATAKMLVVSTASPYKFAKDVLYSLDGKSVSDDIAALSSLEKLTGVSIPTPLAKVITCTPIYTDVIDKEEMPEATRAFALK